MAKAFYFINAYQFPSWPHEVRLLKFVQVATN